MEDRYKMPCRGVVLEKWLGGTGKQKVGEEWPGPVKCVYTLRLRIVHRICRGLETEPGCGGVVPHRFVFLALHGRHSKSHTGHVEKLRLRPEGYREGGRTLRTPLGKLRLLHQSD